MKNEKGYALVLVLLIIALTFTFALSMSGMALTARKQINKTDEVNKATDLAEMGIAHFEAVLARMVNDSNKSAGEKILNAMVNAKNKHDSIPAFDTAFKQDFKDKIRSLSALPSKTVDGKNEYQVLNFREKTTSNPEIFPFSFDSRGKTASETKTILTEIDITKRENLSIAGETTPRADAYGEIERNYVHEKPNRDKTPLIYDQSTYFNEQVYIQGNEKLFVNGDVFFNKTVRLNGTADILIHGNAIFRSRIDDNVRGAYSFCITGNIYLVENGKLVEYTSFPEGKKASCPKAERWEIDLESGIDVTY